MNHITPVELKKKMDSSEDFHLIDVREYHEHNEFNLGGQLIPLGEIMNLAGSVPSDVPVILYCKLGIRSQIAIQRLHEKFGFNNLLNLQGGIERWKKEIKG